MCATMNSTKVPSYAKRLSHNPSKGVVGLAEALDSESSKTKNLAKLTRFFKDSKRIVVLTGAGISTSAGIADFRGPNGVWTKEEASKKPRGGSKRPKKSNDTVKSEEREADDASFEQARPTRTHGILTALHAAGKIRFVISQNVDGLHLRSKFPRESLVELHGNVFLERCSECRHEVFHDRDLGGVGCRPTGSKCSLCDSLMHDTVLDWDTPIDETDFQRAEEEICQADMVICLGTSLRIVPAAELPLLVGTKRRDDIEPRICIVNLQKTPLDQKADIVIHRKVDEIMEHIWNELQRSSELVTLGEQSKPTEKINSRPKRSCTLNRS